MLQRTRRSESYNLPTTRFWNHKTRDLQIAAPITENRCENCENHSDQPRREHSRLHKVRNCGKILIVKIGEHESNRIFFLHRIPRFFQDLIIANYGESYNLTYIYIYIYMYIENLYWKYLTGLMYIGSRYFRNYTCARLLMLIRIKGIDPRGRSSR